MNLAIAILACVMAAAEPRFEAPPKRSWFAYRAPKTSFGDPDLQGLWTNASLTSLEKIQGVPKLELSREEAAPVEAHIQEATARADDEGQFDFPDRNGRTHKVLMGFDGTYRDAGKHLGYVNGSFRTAWLIDPPDGLVPYSREGAKFFFSNAFSRSGKIDNYEQLWAAERCLAGFGSSAGPPMLNALYNNLYQIVQSPGHVVIVAEMIHDARIIRLGGQHLPAVVDPFMGDSIGHWDGSTLVVETTNLNPLQAFSFTPPRQKLYVSPKSKITEWFTRVALDEILYQFQVEEPYAYTQPWRGEMTLLADKGPMYEYACHEGNHAVQLVMGAARYSERKDKK